MSTCLALPSSEDEEKQKVATNIARWCQAFSDILTEAMRFILRGLSVLWCDVEVFELEYDPVFNDWDFTLIAPKAQYTRRIVIEYSTVTRQFLARFSC